MKRFLCSLTLVWLLTLLSVQANELIVNAHWLKNEYQSYRVCHKDYRLLQGDTLWMEAFSFRTDVMVCDSSFLGYTMQWRLSDFSVQTTHYLSLQWMNSLESFTLSYHVSPQGVLRELHQPKQFDRELDQSIDAFFAGYHGTTDLAARERLYALRHDVMCCVLSSIQQFHQLYGLGYTLGEVVKVPTQLVTENDSIVVEATTYKKLESYRDDVATLVSSTVLEDAAHLPPREQVGAMLVHLPTGWPVFTYETKETLLRDTIYGEYNDIQHSY